MLKKINTFWPIIGLIISLGIMIWLITNSMHLTSPKSLFLLNFAFLLLHQFEEYILPGGFKKFFNNEIRKKAIAISCSLTDSGIFLVNVCLAWTAYYLATLNPDKYIWFGVALVIISLINGIVHSLMFLKLRKYNPGFLTGLFLFIPFGIFALYHLWDNITSLEWLYISLIAIVGSLCIPFIICLTDKWEKT